jgi:hypothetical protein
LTDRNPKLPTITTAPVAESSPARMWQGLAEDLAGLRRRAGTSRRRDLLRDVPAFCVRLLTTVTSDCRRLPDDGPLVDSRFARWRARVCPTRTDHSRLVTGPGSHSRVGWSVPTGAGSHRAYASVMASTCADVSSGTGLPGGKHHHVPRPTSHVPRRDREALEVTSQLAYAVGGVAVEPGEWLAQLVMAGGVDSEGVMHRSHAHVNK